MRRLCLHAEAGLHYLRGVEAGNLSECRRHCSKGQRQTPVVRNQIVRRTWEDSEVMEQACLGVPRDHRSNQPERDGFVSYLQALGRPLDSSQGRWSLHGVAVVDLLDWRLESEALHRSLLEWALIFYKHWSLHGLDSGVQRRILCFKLGQFSLSLAFDPALEIRRLTGSPPALPDRLWEISGLLLQFLEAIAHWKRSEGRTPVPVLGHRLVQVLAPLRTAPVATSKTKEPASKKTEEKEKTKQRSHPAPSIQEPKRQKPPEIAARPRPADRRLSKPARRYDDEF